MRNREFAYQNLLDSVEQALELAYQEHSKEDFKDVFISTLMQLNAGMNVYFAKSAGINARNKVIRRKFNGTNQAELARRFGISLQWVYKILEGDCDLELD
ncbi:MULTISPECIES: Mor transcription activator family protein [Pasteurellaceae]|uniref:Mor transcription activator family protein n=1 Tax=Pasteurellaceae TaxID=712 RepID=UPI0023F1E8CC|nr:Mor transcription activator family protein [Actinobacillus minor]MDD6909908.1 Mor transcription activator family protein [Actinobacillus minor]MDY4713817.1 Mor transcription activator family protein [Actinobacillus minor]MEE3690669.1 Mor transcription activator family protein [Glaesserella parasuis]